MGADHKTPRLRSPPDQNSRAGCTPNRDVPDDDRARTASFAKVANPIISVLSLNAHDTDISCAPERLRRRCGPNFDHRNRKLERLEEDVLYRQYLDEVVRVT